MDANQCNQLNIPPEIGEIISIIRRDMTSEDKWEYCKNFLSERANIFTSAAQTIITNPSGFSTSLLITVLDYIDNIVACTCILAFQSENLSDKISDHFVFVIRILFGKLSRKALTIVYTEAVSIASKLGNAKSLLLPLQHVLGLLPVGPTCLTSLQTDLLQMYTYGHKYVTSTPILEINMKLTPVSSADFLKYFYYAALLCIGMRNYIAALDNLSQVVSTPATALSQVVVDAVKKARLLALIESGTAFVPSKGAAVSQIVQKFLKQPLPVYDQLVRAFQADDLEQLRRLIAQSQEHLVKDGNLGLAKQLEPVLIRTRIRTLASSYMTMSLQDIASSVGLASAIEAEKTLLGLLGSNEVSVRIDQQSSTVHFVDDDFGGNEAVDVIAQLHNNMSRSMELSEELRRMQKAVMTSPDYIARVSAPSFSGPGPTSVGLAWQGEDADVMDMSAISRYV